MTAQISELTEAQQARKGWLAVLAKSSEEQLSAHMEALGDLPEHTLLRAPEVGGVMVRGRMGGTGAPFNLGEMTVTRCSVQIASGEVGHGYVQGCSKAQARNAALIDAMMQTPRAPAVEAAVLAPLKAAHGAKKDERAQKAAATKVDFFTMVRGED